MTDLLESPQAPSRRARQRELLRKALAHPKCPPSVAAAIRIRLGGRRYSLMDGRGGTTIAVDRRHRSRKWRLPTESFLVVRMLESVALKETT